MRSKIDLSERHSLILEDPIKHVASTRLSDDFFSHVVMIFLVIGDAILRRGQTITFDGVPRARYTKYLQ